MQIKTMGVAAGCLAMLLGAGSAQAQSRTWDDTGYAAFNIGFQTQSRSFTELSAPEIYSENAVINVPHNVSGGVLLDFAGGVRIWRNLGVGIGFSRFADDESPTLSADVPNPIFAGSPRTAVASTGKLSHSETAIHLQALWMIPTSDDIQLAVVLGPSIFSIKQDFVTGISTDEAAFPFSTTSISSVSTGDSSKRVVGFTAGVDGTYLVTPRMGVGAFLRLSSASADIGTTGGGTVTVDAGGFQIGVGLRTRF
jgi:hypothetical protein